MKPPRLSQQAARAEIQTAQFTDRRSAVFCGVRTVAGHPLAAIEISIRLNTFSWTQRRQGREFGTARRGVGPLAVVARESGGGHLLSPIRSLLSAAGAEGPPASRAVTAEPISRFEIQTFTPAWLLVPGPFATRRFAKLFGASSNSFVARRGKRNPWSVNLCEACRFSAAWRCSPQSARLLAHWRFALTGQPEGKHSSSGKRGLTQQPSLT